MKVTRNSSGLFANRSPRGRGCAPLLILLMVATAVVSFGRHWIGQRLNLNRPQRAEANLPAAFLAFDSGDLRTAVDYASQVAQRDNADADAYEFLIRALIYRSYSDIGRESDRERALQFSREAIALFPRNQDLQAVNSYALQANMVTWTKLDALPASRGAVAKPCLGASGPVAFVRLSRHLRSRSA